MVPALVFCAFIAYALLVVLFGYHWRRHGFQWIEYVAGALIVVSGTWWQLVLSPSADWFTTITLHYGIAGLVVIPMEIGLAIHQKRQAEAIRAGDEG